MTVDKIEAIFASHVDAPDRSDELCPTCKDPGRCCRAFYLATVEDGPATARTGATREGAQATMDAKGWPFLPVKHRPFEVDGATVDAWLFTCPKLTEAGRCSAYDARPEVCRAFKAGSDPLCVYYEPEG